MGLQDWEAPGPFPVGAEGVTGNWPCKGGRESPAEGCFPGKLGFSHGEHSKNIPVRSSAHLGLPCPNLPIFLVPGCWVPAIRSAPEGWD